MDIDLKIKELNINVRNVKTLGDLSNLGNLKKLTLHSIGNLTLDPLLSIKKLNLKIILLTFGKKVWM